jgi:hypothetical protein
MAAIPGFDGVRETTLAATSLKYDSTLCNSICGVRAAGEADWWHPVRSIGLGDWLSESSVISVPTFRANEIVIGYRPIPSVEFQFILVNARSSFARSRISVGPHEPI